MCWSCEGRIPDEAENCPYCGVYISPHQHLVQDHPQQAPYPYFGQSNQKIPIAPYRGKAEEPTEKPKEEVADAPVPRGDVLDVLLPLGMLLSGTCFLLFGFALYFFSENGILVLRWNADLWPYFAFASLPLLIFGWRYLESMKE